jgi:hypothetical protein
VTHEDTLRDRLRESAVGGGLPCALAHRLAASRAVPPRVVGETADSLGIRITHCQLGLFGYDAYGEKRWTRRLATLPPDLERGVHQACTDGRLTCAAAWLLADERGLPRLLFGSVAETLDVRISGCPLGCFE